MPILAVEFRDMTINSSYMRLAGRGDLDRQRQERRTKGRMPMVGLYCNRGAVLDLSPGGTCIRRRSFFAWPVGKSMVIVFNFEGQKLAVKAKVARVVKDGPLARQYGMQFVNLTPQQSIELMRFATSCRPQLLIADRTLV